MAKPAWPWATTVRPMGRPAMRWLALGSLVVLTGVPFVSDPSSAAGTTEPGSDGRIVFKRLDRARDETDIYTVNPDGSDVELLFEGPAEGRGGLRMAPRSRSSAATTGWPPISWTSRAATFEGSSRRIPPWRRTAEGRGLRTASVWSARPSVWTIRT